MRWKPSYKISGCRTNNDLLKNGENNAYANEKKYRLQWFPTFLWWNVHDLDGWVTPPSFILSLQWRLLLMKISNKVKKAWSYNRAFGSHQSERSLICIGAHTKNHNRGIPQANKLTSNFFYATTKRFS